MKREGRRGFGDNVSGTGSAKREDGAVVLRGRSPKDVHLRMRCMSARLLQLLHGAVLPRISRRALPERWKAAFRSAQEVRAPVHPAGGLAPSSSGYRAVHRCSSQRRTAAALFCPGSPRRRVQRLDFVHREPVAFTVQEGTGVREPCHDLVEMPCSSASPVTLDHPSRGGGELRSFPDAQIGLVVFGEKG